MDGRAFSHLSGGLSERRRIQSEVWKARLGSWQPRWTCRGPATTGGYSMHKTLLAVLIGSSVFAVLPALAQVDLGGAGRIGAGVTAGAGRAVSRTPAQLGTHADQSLQRADRHARHGARHATEQTRRTLDRHGRADIDAAASGSAGTRAGDQ